MISPNCIRTATAETESTESTPLPTAAARRSGPSLLCTASRRLRVSFPGYFFYFCTVCFLAQHSATALNGLFSPFSPTPAHRLPGCPLRPLRRLRLLPAGLRAGPLPFRRVQRHGQPGNGSPLCLRRRCSRDGHRRWRSSGVALRAADGAGGERKPILRSAVSEIVWRGKIR